MCDPRVPPQHHSDQTLTSIPSPGSGPITHKTLVLCHYLNSRDHNHQALAPSMECYAIAPGIKPGTHALVNEDGGYGSSLLRPTILSN